MQNIVINIENKVIDDGTFQNDMTTIKLKDDVLTLLVYLGYLAYNSAEKRVFIPNEEVRQEFVRAVTLGKHACKIEEYCK